MLSLPAFLNINLYERADFLRQFPWRGAFARGQADYDRPDLAIFTRLERDILSNVVAFVQQPDHRHAVWHRGGAVIFDRRSGGGGACLVGCVKRNRHRFRLGRLAIAGGQCQRAGQRNG